MKPISMLINGEATQASNGATFDRLNPLDGSVATRAPAATVGDAIEAVEAAASAFPAWSATGPGERRALLLKAAEALEAKAAVVCRRDRRGDRWGRALGRLRRAPGRRPSA